jgi:hypothetical protein
MHRKIREPSSKIHAKSPRLPDSCVWWLKTKLLPKLARGDVIVMDNLAAHHDARVLGLPSLPT